MAWASTAPDAIAALVAALKASPALSGVKVADGPEVIDGSLMEFVAVGFAGPEDTTSVEAALSAEGMVASPDREQYTIRCVAMVANGAGDIAAARNRAYELLAAAGAVLAGDATLGGAVMFSQIADYTLTQSQGSGGAIASLTFGVFCDAFTKR